MEAKEKKQEMNIDEILEAKLQIAKDDIISAINDIERGFESGQVSVGQLKLEDGKVIEIQINVTSNEDDFIDYPQP